jgi:hypothetical protein
MIFRQSMGYQHPVDRVEVMKRKPRGDPPDVRIVPLADSTIYEMEQRGEFPRGFALSPRCVVWDLAGQRDQDCGTVDAIATEHLAEVDRKIADLTALRRELADAVTSCQGGTVAECRILEAFSPAAAS